MRYTVTYEVYIEGDNNKHALSKAELIAKNQNAYHPNQQWDVHKLHITPFASLNTQEVDIDAIRTEKLLKENLPF
jgi:hypothetical protein|tara:strand:+ start:1991 stop:2215 length:225 start_codon:yes stop_codon:yes gene_type:complete